MFAFKKKNFDTHNRYSQVMRAVYVISTYACYALHDFQPQQVPTQTVLGESGSPDFNDIIWCWTGAVPKTWAYF